MSRKWDCDVVYLYVTGIFTVLISLIPIFRGSFVIPFIIPMWAALYSLYRYRIFPEKYKYLLNGLFLAGCYLILGKVAATFTGSYHGMDVLALEEKIFGVLPSRWLQGLISPTTGCSKWFDYPLALAHSTFFSFPFITPWLIYRVKGIDAMKRAILAFAFITTTGYLTYILWPLTPPWLLAADGLIEPLQRCVFRALQQIVPAFLVSSASNTPRAAMPSLHAGVTLLMVILLFRELGAKRSWWSLLILIAICFEIIYGAEHFVIDVAAGFLFALGAYAFSYIPRFGR